LKAEKLMEWICLIEKIVDKITDLDLDPAKSTVPDLDPQHR
jgi:hypothetical protein